MGETRGRTTENLTSSKGGLLELSNQQASQRLKALLQLNSNRDWQNKDLYRLMYREDLYVLAYERVKSKPANVTTGTDGATLDGFSMDQIQEIIRQMRDETFQ